MTIKHLVLSGGAYKGFYMIGALEYLMDNKFVDLNNIETIYGVSVGAMMGLCICLGIDIKDLKKYLVTKEWKNSFNFSINSVLNVIQKKGYLDKEFMKSIYKTLFRAKGLSINSTFKDIYEHSKIELNIFATNMTTFKLEQYSHKTHPEMLVIDAVYMSSSLPFIFQPEIINDNCYIDGGIINPYPLNICLSDLKKKNPDINYKEILGFKILNDKLENITSNSSIFEMGFNLINTLIDENHKHQIKKVLNYEIIIPTRDLPPNEVRKIICFREKREALIKIGANYGKIFLNYLNQSSDKL